jgi:hypothetical protein
LGLCVGTKPLLVGSAAAFATVYLNEQALTLLLFDRLSRLDVLVRFPRVAVPPLAAKHRQARALLGKRSSSRGGGGGKAEHRDNGEGDDDDDDNLDDDDEADDLFATRGGTQRAPAALARTGAALGGAAAAAEAWAAARFCCAHLSLHRMGGSARGAAGFGQLRAIKSKPLAAAVLSALQRDAAATLIQVGGRVG